jgi:hypothetical protein
MLFPENVVLGSVAYRIRLLMGAEHLVVRGCAGEADVTLFLADGVVAALVQGKRPALSGWRRCAGPPAVSNHYQISELCRDEDGRPILPTSRVTALVEVWVALATELGTLDAVTRSITRGQLVMYHISAPSQQKVLHNHLS